MMVRVLPPRLCLLEGAEGSQLIISLRQGVGSLPACDPHATGHYRVHSRFPSSKENSWCERTMGMGWGDTFLPPVLLQNTHFGSNSWHKGSGQTCRLPQSSAPISECTKQPGAAPGWEKHPIFAEGPLTMSSEHPRAMGDAAAGGGAQPRT